MASARRVTGTIALLLLSLAAPLTAQGRASPDTAGHTGATMKSARPADSSAMRRRAERALGAFFSVWRSEWSSSQIKTTRLTPRGQRDRLPQSDDLDVSLTANHRVLSLSCRSQPPFDPRIRTAYGTLRHPHLIEGFGNVASAADSRINLCPVWVPGLREPADAQLGVDFDLDLGSRAFIRSQAREPVLGLLDSIGHLLPGDPWISGQRVRMALDQGDVARARTAVAECRSSAWWCTTLDGMISFWLRDLPAADARFVQAVSLMPDAVRCEWNDASRLFLDDERMEYRRLGCAQRDSVNEVLWWLADPLYLEEGNARRAEHYGRKALIAVRSSLPYDERWDWGQWRGGQSRAEMVERYGWPTSMRYLGTRELQGLDLLKGFPSISRGIVPLGDDGFGVPPAESPVGPLPRLGSLSNPVQPSPAQARLDQLLAEDRSARDGLSASEVSFNTPLTTAEYWGPQFHTVPPLDALRDPFRLPDAIWDLNPKLEAGTFDRGWWPREFARRDPGPLIALPNQVAMFRREHAAVMVAAAQWDSSAAPPAGPVTTVFGVITSTGARGVTNISTDTAPMGQHRPIVTALPARPLLLGLEVIPAAGAAGPAGRARFGVTPPAGLAAFPDDSVAVSDPLLFAVFGQVDQVRLTEAIGSMWRTVDFVDPVRVGVFWETYGVKDSDTTNISIRVVRFDDRGIARRALSIVGLGFAGGRDSVTMRARRTRQGPHPAEYVGGVPVLSSSLVLNLSELDPGRYLLEILVAREDGRTGVARREFTVKRSRR